MSKTIRLGSRSSPLALKQAEIFYKKLEEKLHIPESNVKIRPINTSGDKYIDKKISDLGIKGVFTKELELALLENEIDIAVHSMKDMPAEIHPDLVIAGVLPRDDVRDIIIGFKNKIEELPYGCSIGTSSLRRESQIKRRRPDIKIIPIRGNIGTRISKVGEEVDGIILAKAGLDRMNYQIENSCILSIEDMIPAAAQGVIALQIRKNDTDIKNMLELISDKKTMLVAECERAFLKGWEDAKYSYTGEYSSSCRIPIAAHALIDGEKIYINAMVENNGDIFIKKDSSRIENAEQLGYKTAIYLADNIFKNK